LEELAKDLSDISLPEGIISESEVVIGVVKLQEVAHQEWIYSGLLVEVLLVEA
jgi:hypothetical protein